MTKRDCVILKVVDEELETRRMHAPLNREYNEKGSAVVLTPYKQLPSASLQTHFLSSWMIKKME